MIAYARHQLQRTEQARFRMQEQLTSNSGNWLGDERPLPAGLNAASSLGSNSNCTNHVTKNNTNHLPAQNLSSTCWYISRRSYLHRHFPYFTPAWQISVLLV
jgi:hypothetical protein